MVTFWLIALLMVAVLLAFLLPPLLRKKRVDHVQRDTLNVALFRDRMEELEGELKEGELSPEESEQAHNELRRDLLVNTELPANARVRVPGSGRWAAVMVGIGVPVLAVLIYLHLGAPSLINQPARIAVSDSGLIAQVSALEKMLQSDPRNFKGWTLLGRSLMEMQRYGGAVKALGRADTLAPNTPEILTDYAQALALVQGGSLQGRPGRLIDRALRVAPDLPSGLWLAGLNLAQRGDFTRAMARWDHLLTLVPADSDTAKMVRVGIAQVRKAMATAGQQMPQRKTTSKATSAGVTVRVALGRGLKANPNASVFIFAQVPGGSPMPLAAQRRRVADLPLTLKLTPMGGVRPLASYPQLQFTARVSVSGTVRAQSGDLEGDVVAKPLGPVVITINKVVP